MRPVRLHTSAAGFLPREELTSGRLLSALRLPSRYRCTMFPTFAYFCKQLCFQLKECAKDPNYHLCITHQSSHPYVVCTVFSICLLKGATGPEVVLGEPSAAGLTALHWWHCAILDVWFDCSVSIYTPKQKTTLLLSWQPDSVFSQQLSVGNMKASIQTDTVKLYSVAALPALGYDLWKCFSTPWWDF